MNYDTPLKIPVRRLPGASELSLPAYATDGSVGLDLPAAVDEFVLIDPGARVLVPTGFALAIPKGYEGQVRPRSGLAVKYGITIPNAPGTIDSDYRGEVMGLLLNCGDEQVTVRRGDRIAQLIIAPVTRAELIEVPVLETTKRGTGGFGHTGRGES